MNTQVMRETMTFPKQSPSTKELFKPYSTLIALVVLMVLFELTGRIWNYDVKSQVMAWISGEAPLQWDALTHALTSGLTSTDAAFFTPRNLTNLSLQVSINGILAIGMTMIILTAGIDLGIGSVVALCGIFLGLAQAKWGWNLPSSLALAVAVGTAVGSVNGFLISKFRIPPFVVTLGFLVIARGLALIFSGSSAISPLSDEVRFLGGGFVSPWILVGLGAVVAIGGALMNRSQAQKQVTAAPAAVTAASSGDFLEKALPVVLFLLLGGMTLWAFFSDRGLPVPVLVLVVASAVGIFVLSKTTFGRGLYALGGNETAALLSGIPVQRIKFIAYVVMGFLAGVAGIILSGRLNSATPTEGQLMELDAIAAVVIGGTSLQGGVGRIQGSIIGAFIIGVLNNGMDMLELSTDYQMVVKGLIIVFAVWSDSRAKKR
jgi:D-xylose transport system permease protein